MYELLARNIAKELAKDYNFRSKPPYKQYYNAPNDIFAPSLQGSNTQSLDANRTQVQDMPLNNWSIINRMRGVPGDLPFNGNGRPIPGYAMPMSNGDTAMDQTWNRTFGPGIQQNVAYAPPQQMHNGRDFWANLFSRLTPPVNTSNQASPLTLAAGIRG